MLLLWLGTFFQMSLRSLNTERRQSWTTCNGDRILDKITNTTLSTCTLNTKNCFLSSYLEVIILITCRVRCHIGRSVLFPGTYSYTLVFRSVLVVLSVTVLHLIKKKVCRRLMVNEHNTCRLHWYTGIYERTPQDVC